MPGLLILLVFLCGIASLIYLATWTCLWSAIFGRSIDVLSTMLAAFLSGMAVGSLVLGRWAVRQRKVLLLFAGLQAFLGITAFLTPWLMGPLEDVCGRLFRSLPAVPEIASIVKPPPRHRRKPIQRPGARRIPLPSPVPSYHS